MKVHKMLGKEILFFNFNLGFHLRLILIWWQRHEFADDRRKSRSDDRCSHENLL